LTTRSGYNNEECKKAGISPLEIRHGFRRRPVSRLRAVIALRSRTELGLFTAEIARHLGVATSNFARAIDKVEKKRTWREYAS